MAELNANKYNAGFTKLNPANIASFLGKKFTDEENALVKSLIEASEKEVARYCNRNFKFQDSGSTDQVYYELVDAGQLEYELFNYPIKKVTKIEVNDATVYDADNEATYGIYLGRQLFAYDTYIQLTQSLQSSIDNRRAMKIYYTIDEFWGGDITQAVRKLVAEEFTARSYGGKQVASFNVPQMSVTFDNQKSLEKLYRTLNAYRKINV